MVTPAHFTRAGLIIMGRGDSRDSQTMFGANLEVCALCWNLLDIPPQGEPQHLLWALMLLKTYAKEKVLASLAHVDRRTYWNWAWIFIWQIAGLRPHLVSFLLPSLSTVSGCL